MNPILKKSIGIITGIVIGFVFIFSAISKLPTLEQFGWTIVETTHMSWALAEWGARLLIGIELLIGVFFVFRLYVKKYTIPASIFLLITFTIYLFMVLKTQGNDGNCGCFGEVITMTPIQSIIKNVALILLIVFLYFFTFEWELKQKNLSFALCIFTLITPFLWSPPESIYINEKEKELNQPIPLSILYQSENNPPPQVELRKGKHVLLFLSLTCKYCKKAAKRVRIMKEQHPEIPFYAILNGESSDLETFMRETRMSNIPYSMFNGADEYTQMSGGYTLPSIKWVQDTTVIKEPNYITLNENEIIQWLKENK
ncbi:MAG: DoxX family protein [Bacteroidetes bacterium OLB11]|nr:MAG: DoxX family protein [Bacteroidetes bacterium OLB11]